MGFLGVRLILEVWLYTSDMQTVLALLCYFVIWYGSVLIIYVLIFAYEIYKLYLQFMSFLHADTTEVAEIFFHVRQEHTYST